MSNCNEIEEGFGAEWVVAQAANTHQQSRDERDETCIESLRRLGEAERLRARLRRDQDRAMEFRSKVPDFDLLVHGADFFDVGTCKELFALGERLDE